MIYTVTFNPALDYIVSVPEFKQGFTNRTETEKILPGGKGINVSIVLKNLGLDTVALGFIAGFTGKEIERRLKESGLFTDFIELKKGISRINVKIRNMEGTEINGKGPDPEEESLGKLSMKLDSLCDGDVLVLAGSVQNSLPDSIYRDFMIRLSDKNVRVAVDASGKLLTNTLGYRPFLIKPNLHELEEIFGRRLSSEEEIKDCALRLRDQGARNVLISMGRDGALLVDEDGILHRKKAPEGRLVNAVGAGDSMVAGFLYGYLSSGCCEDAFIYGIAAGSAGAFSGEMPSKEEIEDLKKKINL